MVFAVEDVDDHLAGAGADGAVGDRDFDRVAAVFGSASHGQCRRVGARGRVGVLDGGSRFARAVAEFPLVAADLGRRGAGAAVEGERLADAAAEVFTGDCSQWQGGDDGSLFGLRRFAFPTGVVGGLLDPQGVAHVGRFEQVAPVGGFFDRLAFAAGGVAPQPLLGVPGRAVRPAAVGDLERVSLLAGAAHFRRGAVGRGFGRGRGEVPRRSRATRVLWAPDDRPVAGGFECHRRAEPRRSALAAARQLCAQLFPVRFRSPEGPCGPGAEVVLVGSHEPGFTFRGERDAASEGAPTDLFTGFRGQLGSLLGPCSFGVPERPRRAVFEFVAGASHERGLGFARDRHAFAEPPFSGLFATAKLGSLLHPVGARRSEEICGADFAVVGRGADQRDAGAGGFERHAGAEFAAARLFTGFGREFFTLLGPVRGFFRARDEGPRRAHVATRGRRPDDRCLAGAGQRDALPEMSFAELFTRFRGQLGAFLDEGRFAPEHPCRSHPAVVAGRSHEQGLPARGERDALAEVPGADLFAAFRCQLFAALGPGGAGTGEHPHGPIAAVVPWPADGQELAVRGECHGGAEFAAAALAGGGDLFTRLHEGVDPQRVAGVRRVDAQQQLSGSEFQPARERAAARVARHHSAVPQRRAAGTAEGDGLPVAGQGRAGVP